MLSCPPWTAGRQSETVTGKADLKLDAESSENAKLAWERVLVPVDRMSSVLTGITLQELRGVWTGASTTTNFATIYPDETIVPYLDALLGAHGSAVKPQPKTAVADAVWGDRMGLGIVPFEDLNVRLRAIPVDGNSPTDNRFRAADWPLTARAWLSPVPKKQGPARRTQFAVGNVFFFFFFLGFLIFTYISAKLARLTVSAAVAEGRAARAQAVRCSPAASRRRSHSRRRKRLRTAARRARSDLSRLSAAPRRQAVARTRSASQHANSPAFLQGTRDALAAWRLDRCAPHSGPVRRSSCLPTPIIPSTCRAHRPQGRAGPRQMLDALAAWIRRHHPDLR